MQNIVDQNLNEKLTLEEVEEVMCEFRGTEKKEQTKMKPKRKKKGSLVETIMIIIILVVAVLAVGTKLTGSYTKAADDVGAKLDIEAFENSIN